MIHSTRSVMPAEDPTLEGEKQLQLLLQKQLNTKLTWNLQYHQRKTFTEASLYQPLTQKLVGKLTSDEYQHVIKEDKLRENLSLTGLTKEEIQIKCESDICGNKRKRYGINPESLQCQLQDIACKIAKKQEELKKPDTFSGLKYVSRRNMEIESSHNVGSERSRLLNKLITTHKATDESEVLCNPWTKLPELEKEMMEKLNKKKKSSHVGEMESERTDEKRLSSIVSNKSFCENTGKYLKDNETQAIVTYQNITPLNKEDIFKKKLTVDEIRQIKRFENYTPGEPNNVLFLKNLSKTVEEIDLVALFSQFQCSTKSKLVFRLLRGNMRGQAFITFPDVSTAKTALEAINGYDCKGKPIIIHFAHSKKLSPGNI